MEDPISKLSRNDACHCGSGKKYKKCHLAADAEEASKALAAHNAAVAEAAQATADAEPDDAPAETKKAPGKRAQKSPSAKGPRSEHTARQIRRRGIS